MSIMNCIWRTDTGSESTGENKEVLDLCWTAEYREDMYWVWTVYYTEDWYWVCSGLNRIRRTGSESVVDCRVRGELVVIL